MYSNDFLYALAVREVESEYELDRVIERVRTQLPNKDLLDKETIKRVWKDIKRVPIASAVRVWN